MRGGRINRINASSTAARLTPSRNATSSTFQGSFVLMFEVLMKANRAWRQQDTAGAATRPERLLWSEPPPSWLLPRLGCRPVRHAARACVCANLCAKQAGFASVHAAGLCMLAFRFARRRAT